MQETWVQPLGREDPLEEKMATHSSSCLENSHGQRSLAGYSPWGRKKFNMTEHACVRARARTHTHTHTHTHTGKSTSREKPLIRIDS